MRKFSLQLVNLEDKTTMLISKIGKWTSHNMNRNAKKMKFRVSSFISTLCAAIVLAATECYICSGIVIRQKSSG